MCDREIRALCTAQRLTEGSRTGDREIDGQRRHKCTEYEGYGKMNTNIKERGREVEAK